MAFAQPVNNCRLTVAAPYTPGSGSLSVVDAAPLGFLPSGGYFRLTAFRRALAPAVIGGQTVQLVAETILSILKITGVSGNTLTVGGALDGTEDASLLAGDLLESRVTAGTLFELMDATSAFAQPFFTSFSIGQGAYQPAGATISGSVTFTWATANYWAVAPGTLKITDKTSGGVLASGLSDVGSAAVTLPALVTGSAGQSHTWTISGRDNQNNLFSLDYTIHWIATSDKTYFVNNSTGSDSNAGTSGAPFLTLQHAADVAAAGDVITAKLTGTPYVGFVLGWNAPQHGCAGHPITFTCDAGVVVNHKNPHTQDAIDVESSSFVTISGFSVQNDGSYNRACIRLSGTAWGSRVLNCTVNGGGGVFERFGIFGGFQSDSLVQGNTVHAVGNLGQGTGHGIYWSNSVQRATVQGNTVYDCPGDGIHLNGDASQGGIGAASECVVTKNLIHDCNTAHGGAGLNPDGLVASTISDNLIYNANSAGVTLYQIDAACGSQRNTVVNNTVVCIGASGKWCLNINTNSAGNTVFNNVLWNAGSGGSGSILIDATSKMDFVTDYNVVYNLFSEDGGDTVETLTDWQASVGGAHSVAAASQAALFAAPGSDFHAAVNSPMIDAGVSTLNGKSAPTTDLDGAPRPAGSGYDAGCYEYDPNAPHVASVTPVGGSTQLVNTVTVVFDRDVISGSIAFTLLNAAGVPVAGSGSYNSGTLTYTFTPTTAPLSSQSYTATETGATAVVGGGVQPGPYTWSFTADVPGADENLMGNATPATVDSADASPYTFGMRFKVAADGHVKGARFYKATTNTGTHTAFLWSINQTSGAFGSILAQKNFSGESASGWQSVTFDAEVAVTPGTIYKIGVFMPAGHYSYTTSYFTSDVVNGNITGVANDDSDPRRRNGTFHQSSSAFFPDTGASGAARNYFVDVTYHTG
jgi:hypothetical protein